MLKKPQGSTRGGKSSIYSRSNIGTRGDHGHSLEEIAYKKFMASLQVVDSTLDDILDNVEKALREKYLNS